MACLWGIPAGLILGSAWNLIIWTSWPTQRTTHSTTAAPCALLATDLRQASMTCQGLQKPNVSKTKIQAFAAPKAN
jgi:hypothetical protein